MYYNDIMYNPIELAEQIGSLLHSGRNVFLVGPTDSGKSWFVTNELVPYLNQQKITTKYFNNCDVIVNGTAGADVVVVDEVESLQDRGYLETLHPDESPYYSNEYLAKVTRWHKALSTINVPGVFIASREKQVIPHFVEQVHSLDWNSKPADVIEFTREPGME